MTLNYNIHFEERCGRMLVAARDIEAGEIIFQVNNILILMFMHCIVKTCLKVVGVTSIHISGQTRSHGCRQ